MQQLFPVERDVLHVDHLVHEEGGTLAELIGALGGEVVAGAVLREAIVHVGMAVEIVLEALRHVFALGDDAHAGRRVFHYLVHEERIVRAAEDEGVYFGVGTKYAFNAFLHEIVRSGRVELVVLHERHPHGACLARELDVRPEFAYFHGVRTRIDRPGCAEQADVARLGERTDGFDRGTYHAEHALCGVEAFKVAFLYGAESLCRGRVAGQYDERTALGEEVLYGLERILVDDVVGVGTVGGTCVVAEVEIVVLWQELAYLAENGESAVAGVENADGSHGRVI